MTILHFNYDTVTKVLRILVSTNLSKIHYNLLEITLKRLMSMTSECHDHRQPAHTIGATINQ